MRAEPQGSLHEGLLDAIGEALGKAAVIGGKERPQHVLMLGERTDDGALEVILPS